MDTVNTKAQNEYNAAAAEEESMFSFAKIYEILILHWQWFIISVVVCLAVGAIYVKRTMPIFQVTADFLVKDDQNSRRSARQNDMLSTMMQNGFMMGSEGFDNEVQILQSKQLARKAIIKLGLYTNVSEPEGLRHKDLYGCEPFGVKLASLKPLQDLGSAIVLKVEKNGNNLSVKGKYMLDEKHDKEKYEIDTKGTLPLTISTKVGKLTIFATGNKIEDGTTYTITVTDPDALAEGYVKATTVDPVSKTTTIAHLTHNNTNTDRAVDFLTELLAQYNIQANEDKNEIALKTEEFINERLAKIAGELGDTESELERYKQSNAVVDLQLNAGSSLQSQTQLETKLDEATMQIQLLDYLSEYINDPHNRYQVIPSNIGLEDQPSITLINHFNKTATERNRLLLAASEQSQSVLPLTEELDRLGASIRTSIKQQKQSARITQQSLRQQYQKYSGRVGQSPEQERRLTQIGRQQEVRSALYIMLLEKREENSLSLSATANKGRMYDDPIIVGKVSPKTPMVMLIALFLGLAIPFGIIYLMQLLSYKLESHEQLQKLTNLPIIADIMISEQAKDSKAGIVVRADHNGTMEEIFRGIRTNLNFVFRGNQNVVLFTSSIPGEGKTFCASNTAMSFALLNKRVVLVGLDIRKPRLGELFGFRNVMRNGITNLLCKDEVTLEDIQSQITPSGIHDNLDVLMAGPIPPNPAEQLQSQTLDQIIGILRETYDYVILDTAPVGVVTDTVILQRVTDAIVYVTRADYTPKEEIKMLNNLVAEKKLHNVNVVLNGVDMNKKKYGYQYGYGKYGKYGRYGKRYGYGSYHYGYGYGNSEGTEKGAHKSTDKKA